jgi:hypothetical protein
MMASSMTQVSGTSMQWTSVRAKSVGVGEAFEPIVFDAGGVTEVGLRGAGDEAACLAAPLGHLLVQAAGEADHAGLGRRVDGPHAPRVVGAAAGDIHDLPAALGLHDLDGFAAALDHGDEIDVHNVLDDFVFHVGHFGDLDAGTVVVDEDVEAAESIQGGLSSLCQSSVDTASAWTGRRLIAGQFGLPPGRDAADCVR